MRITLVDRTGTLALADLEEIAWSLDLQLGRDYAAVWQAAAIPVRAAARPEDVAIDESPLVILRDPAEPNALGDHLVTPAGQPIGRAFWGLIQTNGGALKDGPNALSVTCSHEAIEMARDPYVNGWFDGPDGLEYAAEPGDPVEDQSYDLGGVSVSNFVGPRWYREGPGPFDFLGTLTDPFSLTSGGYIRTRGADGVQQDRFGARYPDWRRVLKATGRYAYRRARGSIVT